MGIKSTFYGWLARLSRHLGLWVFSLISRGIAAGYFVFFPGRVKIGLDFYRVLFPRCHRGFHLWCTWMQFQNFTSVYMDRLRLLDHQDISYSYQGWEHLEAAIEGKTGGIILMSHLGNWEVAAYLLKLKNTRLRLLLYMGARQKEDIERIQKQDLTQSGIRVIASDPRNPSPWDIIEAVSFIRSGGFVSLTGDRQWTRGQRTIAVEFLGRRARLPETPHVLALLTGAPLWVFFSFRSGPRNYHFALSAPIRLPVVPRSQRAEVLRQSAQTYAGMLEEALHQNPLEWYHFEPFLERDSN